MWTFWYNQNRLHSSSVGQSDPRTTYVIDAGFWVRISKESDVTCRFCACSCSLTCVYSIWWRCEQQSEVNYCDAKSWPHVACHALPVERIWSLTQVSLISHVAYICTEIPPRSIGCFEMDVNMNLISIYLSPFGCSNSVTASQGHSGYVNPPGRLCIPSRPECVKEDKGIKRDFTIRQTVVTLPI